MPDPGLQPGAVGPAPLPRGTSRPPAAPSLRRARLGCFFAFASTSASLRSARTLRAGGGQGAGSGSLTPDRESDRCARPPCEPSVTCAASDGAANAARPGTIAQLLLPRAPPTIAAALTAACAGTAGRCRTRGRGGPRRSQRRPHSDSPPPPARPSGARRPSAASRR
jgi:hypothetical protein